MIKKLTTMIPWTLLLLLTGSCARLPENNLPLYQRSMIIETSRMEEAILTKASLTESNDPAVNNIRILHLKGTPYEMGFQHGRMLKPQIQQCIKRVMGLATHYSSFEMMDEVYDLMAPYIPREEKEEMRGLAHGADLPLKLIHWFHTIPSVSEYKYKKRFFKKFKPTTCSNIVAFDQATQDGEMYQMRVLDWNRRMGVQKWPVILVHEPDVGNASATYSFAGFIGCVTGMNEQQMAFGEMGYGNPPGESLEGIPFVFLFRKLMREANTLDEAVNMIKNARRTCSYVYMISDAKQSEEEINALLFITDRGRVLTFKENMPLSDERDDDVFPALDDIVYAGAKSKELYRALKADYGTISPQVLMEMSKKVSLKGNIQNVIFKPSTLESWTSYATTTDKKDEKGKACNQKWFYFDLKAELGRF